MNCVARIAAFVLLTASALSLAVPAHAAPQGPVIVATPLLDTDAAHPNSAFRIAVQFNLGSGWHVNAHEPKDQYLVPTVFSIKPADGVTVRETVYPDPIEITLEGASDKLAAYAQRFTIGAEVALADTVPAGKLTLEGKLQYQACDTKQCYPPQSVSVSIPVDVVPADKPLTPQHQDVFSPIHFGAAASPGNQKETKPATPTPRAGSVEAQPGAWRKLADEFAIKGDASGYLGTTDFLAFLDGIEGGQGAPAKNPFAGKAAGVIILLVLGGGLLLNLTPCVLPLIPVNLGIIGAGAKAGSKSRGFLLGGTYGAGIALTYGILGLVVILGVSKTFGAINATPWFNAAIAVIFVALGLAMFDVFLIDFTRFQTRIGVKRKPGGSFAIAFLMGAISALLAGACVAPVIISTIVYAQDQYAKGAAMALFLPFLVGVGMALPWPFAGAGLSFLPKPGKWTERVKQGFGVLIFLFAAYYAHLAYTLFSDRYLVDHEAVRATAQEMDKAGWQSSLDQGLADAKAQGKPVFIDFWATWCKNCLTMNQTTFKNSAVIARLDQYVRIKYQAENPGDPATQEVMDYFGVVGLPTYVIMGPK